MRAVIRGCWNGASDWFGSVLWRSAEAAIACHVQFGPTLAFPVYQSTRNIGIVGVLI